MSPKKFNSSDYPRRVRALKPSLIHLSNDRYIVDNLDWENKIVDFPVEITCFPGCEVKIKNCVFNRGLIVRVNEGVDIKSVFIFRSQVLNGLKVYGSNGPAPNNVAQSIDIDTCSVDRLDVSQLSAKELEVYASSVDELHLNENHLGRVVVNRSHLGLIFEYFNKIEEVDIAAKSFAKKKVIPNNLYSVLRKRYRDQESAKDTSLRVLDLLLRNANITFPSSETSRLFYERNKIQTSSLPAKAVLWMFGYFQSPARYFVTALIWYALIVLMLGLGSVYSGNFLHAKELLRLSLNSFFGLSYTLESSDDFLSSIILSFAIGAGTVLYSALLVTMINRFRIRF